MPTILLPHGRSHISGMHVVCDLANRDREAEGRKGGLSIRKGSEENRLTPGVLHRPLHVVRVLWIRLDVRVAREVRHDAQRQLDHHDLDGELGLAHATQELPSSLSCLSVTIATASKELAGKGHRVADELLVDAGLGRNGPSAVRGAGAGQGVGRYADEFVVGDSLCAQREEVKLVSTTRRLLFVDGSANLM